MPTYERFSFTSERAKRRISRILDLLSRERLSVHEISDRIHATPSLTNTYVKHLREGKPKRVFIAEWRDGEARKLALFATGNKRDLAYPKKTKAQYWEEIKRSPEKRARVRDNGRRSAIKRRGREHLIRECRKYNPPLVEQVAGFVLLHRFHTAPEIATRINAPVKSVKQCLSDLKRRGKVCYKTRTRHGAQWEPVITHIQHEPIITRAQGIFAALGV